MKKLLIVNNNLQIGGVQSALINLLSEISSSYALTLFVFSPCGALRERLPDNVRLLTAHGALRYWGMSSKDTKNRREKLCRGFWAVLTKTLGRRRSFRLASLRQKKLEGYDAAISFLHSGPPRLFYGGCNEFVLRCVNANRKITFLHCDFEKQKADSACVRAVYHGFDLIAACSAGCRDSFLRVMPELSARTRIVPNCLDRSYILSMAKAAPAELPSDSFNVLSVARLGKEKGILRAVAALSKLNGRQKALRYYIIGDGIQREELLREIRAGALEQTVIWLGQMENPYGYMSAADLLLIPSYSEAAPMVIGEASLLGTPILSTDTCSAREMIEAPGIGLVCENSVDGIAQGLERMMSDPLTLEACQKACARQANTNQTAVSRFAELLEQE